MTTILHPLLARCADCPEWEVDCGRDATRKARLEQLHRDRLHAHSIDSVTGLVAADPMHDSDVETIVAAIELDGSANSGEVDPNRVRMLLPSHIQPTLIGATYNTLIRRGRLQQIGWTTNRDRHGRNVGKPIAIYELRPTTEA